MSLPRVLLVALCLTSVILTGCGKNNNNSSNAQMRVVNAFSQANALDVSVNSKPVVSGLPFQSMSQYADVDSGSQITIVGVTGASTALINTTYNLGSNTKYSYVIYGPQTAVAAQLLADSFNDPGDGFFSVRLVNAAPGPGALDLYLTAPGADLTATAPAVANIPYSSASLFVPVTKGTNFEIRITPAGTKDVIYDGAPQTFAEHSGATVVALGKGSGKLVNVILLREDDAGSGTLIDNLLTQYKVVNASLVPSALNVLVDGTLQLSNIPYTGVSNYQRTSAGTHNFSFEATTTPGASLLRLVQTLTAATDTSIVLTGTAGALNALVLQDNNLPPPVSTANVRFVNSSADVAAVDVFINFSKQVSNLTANSASAYINLSAAASTGTSYEFDFNVAGTTTSVLKLTSVVLTAGHTYTVYLAGPASSLRGIVSQDN
ncbi:MAG TPA: DUF4397 domain-containing protein [Casimicrobiaceae bacterium]|jgi:hypothetical protein|nr:DUF4397 domain-containing protein [Casimicrobiaceae bacterium]